MESSEAFCVPKVSPCATDELNVQNSVSLFPKLQDKLPHFSLKTENFAWPKVAWKVYTASDSSSERSRMLISGVKHACATCIRGHRSSTCNHSDRPLFEIRKKGRPVSQCPHCRDLRQIKSCHTKCECGETPAEQSKTSTCKCHSGEPCCCAGPVQVYQYIPPDLSSGSSTSASNSHNEGPKTPNSGMGSMLHMFRASSTEQLGVLDQVDLQSTSQKIPNPPSKHFLDSSSSGYANTTDSTLAIGSSFDKSQLSNRHETQHTSKHQPADSLGTFSMFDSAARSMRSPSWPASSTEPMRPRKMQRRGSSSISKSTRSIGTNTEPLPPNIWPDDPFEVPHWMQIHRESEEEHPSLEAATSAPQHCCPKVKDMPLQDLGFDHSGLTNATAPVPLFSTFYKPGIGGNDPHMDSKDDPVMAIDHYPEEFDPEYFDALFDVPGCSLPGVQCRCGDDCSCAGCQTHKDNLDRVTFAEFERMDVQVQAKGREHPPDCCDTRSIHTVPATGKSAASCCKSDP